MSTTTWIAVFCFCLAISVGSIAITVARPQAFLFIEATPDQGKIGRASVPNELAKSDQLELTVARVETAITPTAELAPVEAHLIKIEKIKVPSRHWQDANARIPPSQPPHKHNIIRELKRSASSNPRKVRAEVWHCRQDAMGSLLRSLDLSPRCNL